MGGQCSLLLNLMQKGRELLTIGFSIYSLDQEEPEKCSTGFFQTNKICCERFSAQREVSGRFKLPPGTYLIVPSTFQPDQQADFMLRVSTEEAVNSVEL